LTVTVSLKKRPKVRKCATVLIGSCVKLTVTPVGADVSIWETTAEKAAL